MKTTAIITIETPTRIHVEGGRIPYDSRTFSNLEVAITSASGIADEYRIESAQPVCAK